MTQYSKTVFLSTYNGIFATTGAENISAADLRQFVQDLIDSFPSFVDDADIMSLFSYNASTGCVEGQATIYNGKIYLCIFDTTGSFDATKFVQLPVDDNVLSVAAWSNSTSYVTGNIVRHKFRLFICAANNAGHEPGTDSYWDLISLRRTQPTLDWTFAYYADGDQAQFEGVVYTRNGAGYSSDIVAEYGSGDWLYDHSVIYTKQFAPTFASTDYITSTTRSQTYFNVLPAGAHVISIKFKLEETFDDGSGCDMVCDVCLGTDYLGVPIGSAPANYTPADTAGHIVPTSTVFLIPDQENGSSITIGFTTTTGDMGSLVSGKIRVWITYTIAR